MNDRNPRPRSACKHGGRAGGGGDDRSLREVRKARGRRLPRLLFCRQGLYWNRLTHDKEEAMKNKLVEALHSDTFRSLAIALLMVTVAILLSACAGGPVHPGGGGE